MIKTTKTITSCGLVAASLFVSLGGQAAAQTAGAPVAASQLSGPLVPGVCLFGREDLIAHAKIGLAAGERLRGLAQQAQAGLDAEKATLNRQAAALKAQRATLTPAQLQAQAEVLNKRAQAIQAEAGTRSRQLEATRQKVFVRILEEAQPYIAQSFKTHGCGLLFAREAVLGGNTTNDITAEVTAALDAGGAPLSFDLEPAAATPAQ